MTFKKERKKGAREYCTDEGVELLILTNVFTYCSFDIYLRIDKACVSFLKLFTNFPTRKLRQDRQNRFFLQIPANSPCP